MKSCMCSMFLVWMFFSMRQHNYMTFCRMPRAFALNYVLSRARLVTLQRPAALFDIPIFLPRLSACPYPVVGVQHSLPTSVSGHTPRAGGAHGRVSEVGGKDFHPRRSVNKKSWFTNRHVFKVRLDVFSRHWCRVRDSGPCLADAPTKHHEPLTSCCMFVQEFRTLWPWRQAVTVTLP